MGISKLFKKEKKIYYFFQNKGTLVESYEQALAMDDIKELQEIEENHSSAKTENNRRRYFLGL